MLFISGALFWKYMSATLATSNDKNIGFVEIMIKKQSIIKNINWAKEFSSLKKSFFSYPTEEVKFHFNSFNSTKIKETTYNILTLNFDSMKYDFECIRFVLDDNKIIYSFVKDSFNIKIDLIINQLTNQNAIKLKMKNCLTNK